VVRLASTRQLAVILAALTAANSVLLAYAGNTYLTGTVLAALALLLALGCWPLLRPARPAWLLALLSGAVVGWLVMVNPYGALLGLAMWLAVRALGLLRDARPGSSGDADQPSVDGGPGCRRTGCRLGHDWLLCGLPGAALWPAWPSSLAGTGSPPTCNGMPPWTTGRLRRGCHDLAA
jgi:hypothetical protein